MRSAHYLLRSQQAAGVGRPMQASAPAPLKTLMNLTTTIDSLVFSPDTQVRAAHWHVTLGKLNS